MQNVGTVENGVSIFGNKSLWKSNLKTASAGSSSQSKTDKYDDIAFYFLMRTLFHMAMNEVPEITTAETAGGLLRDWAFTDKIESAICSIQQYDNKIKKIVVNLGAAHASRVKAFLTKDGFVGGGKVRLLNAGAFTQDTIMKGINSNIDHTDKLKEVLGGPGYKEACDNFKPSLSLGGNTLNPAPAISGKSSSDTFVR